VDFANLTVTKVHYLTRTENIAKHSYTSFSYETESGTHIVDEELYNKSYVIILTVEQYRDFRAAISAMFADRKTYESHFSTAHFVNPPITVKKRKGKRK